MRFAHPCRCAHLIVESIVDVMMLCRSELRRSHSCGDPIAAGQQAQAGNAQQGTRPECSARSIADVSGLHMPVEVSAV